MPCKIYLRHGQSISDRETYSSDKVTVFAPSWVKEGLKVLGEQLKGIKFELYETQSGASESHEPVESFTITDDFNEQSLIILQKIARNEARNVTGIINKALYSDIEDKRILYSIRDLVRQCIVVGVDTCSRCGGYGCSREVHEKTRCYLCDLAALQFQQPYNSGRLVLIQEKEPHKGILDDLIFERVVGERKRTFEEVKQLRSSDDPSKHDEFSLRYIPHDGYGLPSMKLCYLDTKAYASFVKLDVILCGMAISKVVTAHYPDDKIKFKFLKYGTGFFALNFAAVLDRLILSAVLDGFEELFKRDGIPKVIKCVELPFYKCDNKSSERIKALNDKYGIPIIFGMNDALKQNSKEGLIVATTNCGDNHVVCGNEMGFSSVDAAIAENLDSKGNIFCPNINLLMTEQYIDV